MKRFFLFTFLLCCLTISSNAAQYGEFHVDAYTIGLWHLNGDVNDETGTHNGTNYGATSVNAQFKEGYSFDGSNDYILIPNDSAWNDLSAMTVEVWVNYTTGATVSFIVCKYNATAGKRQWYLGIEIATGYLRFTVQPSPGSFNANYVVSSTTAIPTGQWCSLVAVFSASTFMKIYLNGELLATETTYVASSTGSTTEEVSMGSSYTGLAAQINARVDEVRISNTIRSAEEIRANYAMQKGAYGMIE